MIGTVFRVMLLSLVRDRGALLLAFVLPPLMFLVFAEVFSGAGDEDLTLRIAVLDESSDLAGIRLGEALLALDGIEASERSVASRAELEAAVRDGRADAALWIRGRPGSDTGNGPWLEVLGDGSRALAVAVLSGRVQGVLQREFPDLALARASDLVESVLGPYSPAQRAALEQRLQRLSSEASVVERAPAALDFDQRLLGGGRAMDPGVSYYAAAVAILFLMFAAMQGAISLVDERSSGIVDRLAAGPGGIVVVVLGKGLFLTAQGLVQAGLIFAVAWAVYGLTWPARFVPWSITALLAAAVAAWMGLLLAALCQSRQQAQTASAFVVLILAAVGGSMVPRFLMPIWLRDLGWLTPNAWVIEAWHGTLWRQQSLTELLPAWAVLAGFTLAAMVLALWLSNRNSLSK